PSDLARLATHLGEIAPQQRAGAAEARVDERDVLVDEEVRLRPEHPDRPQSLQDLHRRRRGYPATVLQRRFTTLRTRSTTISRRNVTARTRPRSSIPRIRPTRFGTSARMPRSRSGGVRRPVATNVPIATTPFSSNRTASTTTNSAAANRR